MNSIPASAIVGVVPSVLSAGGRGLALSGLFLTENTRVPIGKVLSFPSVPSVQSFFGQVSTEAAAAAIYFAGPNGSNIKPGAMLFYQYVGTAVAAWLRGGDVSGMTLAALQALSGTVIVTVDGYTHTSASIDLSGASSFSAAAILINAGLNDTEPTEATLTGSIATTVLTVTAVGSGTLAVGQTITGAGVAAGTVITALGTGTGGTGTYTLSGGSQTVASESMTAVATAPAVTYDSTAGAFVITSGITGSPSSIGFATGTLATSLMLTLATGATNSQGAAATTPAAAMSSAAAITTNWGTFLTLFDPDGGSGNALKLAFAQWNATAGDKFLYACWDTDITPTESTDAAGSLGQLLLAANTDGTFLLGGVTDYTKAAFVASIAASLDFTQTNGRTTYCFRTQSGLAPDVTNQTVWANLIANGYNCYATFATANDAFTFLTDGRVPGQFRWADSYVNQIWLNSAFQLAMMILLTNSKSVPYAQNGYALIRAACMDPINAGLNFGAFSAGVPLSALQAAEVNNAAGLAIADTLSAQGWYLQIKAATAQVRGNRASPPMTFWYMDGGSVQKLNLASVEVQ